MLPDLTPAVLRALQSAEHWACLLGATEVEPAHLLYGLLEEPEGRAAGVLIRAGVAIADARRRLEDSTPAGKSHPPGTPLPMGTRTERVLGSAHVLARETSPDRAVASEHVLLAILRTEASLCRLLESLGLGLESLEAAVAGAAPPALGPASSVGAPHQCVSSDHWQVARVEARPAWSRPDDRSDPRP